MQRDPLGYYDSMNLFEYVGSNPVNWIDPWGFETIPFNGDAWQRHKYDPDPHNGRGDHFHSRDTGKKYFPDTNEFYDPKTKKYENAGNKWKKKWEKAYEDYWKKKEKEDQDNPGDTKPPKVKVTPSGTFTLITPLAGYCATYPNPLLCPNQCPVDNGS